LPWRAYYDSDGKWFVGRDTGEKSDYGTAVTGWGSVRQSEADAKLIALAVNTHATLIAALEDEFEALRVWLSNQNNAKPEVIEGMLISRQKIAEVLRQAKTRE
jgi:hypothetical protein